MLDPVYDECGIAAVYSRKGENVTNLLPPMLLDLQNRGQLAAGITRYNEKEPQILSTYKGVGSVSDVFRLTHPDPQKYQSIMDRYSGTAGIGHVRYATCGRDDIAYAQPFERQHSRPRKWFSFCFNGNVTNFVEVKQNLTKEGYHLVLDSDTEFLMHHLSWALSGDDIAVPQDIFGHIANVIDGAWSIAFLDATGSLVIARDPNGFRPLCYAINNDIFAAASESTALTNIGMTDIKDVEPGRLIQVCSNGVYHDTFAKSDKKSFCFFEHVYFANVASRLEGESVYATRRRLGEMLAQGETENVESSICIAVPVPDTAKSAADGMAFKLGIPSREGLIRNRYVGRTFIESADRETRVRRKYTILPEVVKDKRVFLVDDSVVRATTLKIIAKMLREVGAKEIHVRVTCPPIIAPCVYGIDMSSIDELFVPKQVKDPLNLTQEDYQHLAKELDVDSLRYLTVDETKEAIGSEDLCLGCVTGKYPTEWGGKMYKEAKGCTGRVCESFKPDE